MIFNPFSPASCCQRCCGLRVAESLPYTHVGIAFGQRWKITIWWKFQFISERNTEKRANSNFFPAHHSPFQPYEPLTVVAEVVGDEDPCCIPTWVKRTGITLFGRKLSELSENAVLHSKFSLVFEIWPFNIAFSFKCQFFKALQAQVPESLLRKKKPC